MLRIIILVSLFFYSDLLHAHERITSFVSNIMIHRDATLEVEETIEVMCEHDQIKRGIVREFPTTYRDAHNFSYVVDFDVESITHNGYDAAYRIQSASNGKLIYIGDAYTIIPQGKHTYIIKYKTNRQLGFFKDHNELYWNVTGNGWRLPIEKAEAYVHLPQSIAQNAITAEAYTGYQDEQGKNYVYTIEGNIVHFATKHSLRKGEGLTIVTTFPKGSIKKSTPSQTGYYTSYLTEPTFGQKAYWFMRDNFFMILLILELLILLIIIFFGMQTVRLMNKPGIVVPLFYPPQDMTPSQVGFMQNMYFGSTLFPADIVDVAIHGLITIEYVPNLLFGGTYNLTKKDMNARLHEISPYHQNFIRKLFGSKQTIKMTPAFHKNIKSAHEFSKKIVKNKCDTYITHLTSYQLVVGSLFFLIVVTCIMLLSLPIQLFFVACFWMIFAGIWLREQLFRVYTPQGRKLQDAIDGFKMYLVAAEVDRMHIIGTPPTQTPELYEKYLPYAIALGVEHQWTQQFAKMFERLLETQGYVYTPVWYHGRRFSTRDFQSSFSSPFSKSISSAAHRPGSFSGSGGKGRSGGGGGGGGGGGW
ncbi:MAG: DUF2207 domain-containing protein [Candidatus Chromulinivorax sp.]